MQNFATAEQCLRLMHIAEYFALPGDGYQVGGGSPHTEHEHYDGLSLKRAVSLWKVKQMEADSLSLLLNVTRNVKQAVEQELEVTKRLHFAYTHLVCRSAKSGSSALNRTDLSHPVHADNCNIQINGTCPKNWPAFTWRDYTAILYLNDEFEGGEFFFAKDYFGRNVERLFKPACGRLVGFTSGGENLHGVRAVKAGRRCALAIWFTFDPNYAETERRFLHNVNMIPNK